MPLPIASLLPFGQLRSITYELHETSPKTPEHDKQRNIALTAISHLANLGVALKYLSLAKHLTEVSPIEEERGINEFDKMLAALGEIQSCIAGAAYSATGEMWHALIEPPEEADE